MRFTIRFYGSRSRKKVDRDLRGRESISTKPNFCSRQSSFVKIEQSLIFFCVFFIYVTYLPGVRVKGEIRHVVIVIADGVDVQTVVRWARRDSAFPSKLVRFTICFCNFLFPRLGFH